MELKVLRRSSSSPDPLGLARHYAWRALLGTGALHVERAFCLTPETARPVTSDDGAADLRCGELDAARLRAAALDPRGGLDPTTLGSAFDRGDWCVGVWARGELLCHAWFSARPTPLAPGLRVSFDPAYAWAYWAFTRADQRGRHLHARAKLRALELCAARGLRGILSAVRADNEASLRSAARVGCLRVGSLLALGSPWRWAAVTRGCRAYGLRLEWERAAPDARAR